ncbi:MAG: hypothetical protein IVW36_12015 [Dehalococcoidia bacterium]|nr:hypothetical protein [Dehalococcoidia bacterium]
MPDERPQDGAASAAGARRARGGVPRFGDMLSPSDDMIAFVEKYQQAWRHESRAMIALGEFMTARADALRTQAELMRMGSDVARRYRAWSDALLSLRPEAIVQPWLQMRPPRRGGPKADE